MEGGNANAKSDIWHQGAVFSSNISPFHPAQRDIIYFNGVT